ncbi:MAG TPA: tetratricopeptide repeat protein [Longimicrobiales bacterium]|nr:tetratricopeptide repeat protein [Longimicrobiales bacterium]
MMANGAGPVGRLRRMWSRPEAVLLIALVLAGCRDAESSLARGDRLWADSNYTAALAEYRLSQAIRSDSEEILARVAHAYAVTGQFERARESYDELLRMAPAYTDQAVFDYLALARRAQARNDRYGMAGALEAAIALRPGLPVDDMAAPLARFYSRAGDAERAVEFFERALAYAPPDSAAPLLFDYAQFQESQGNCEDAVELFNAFRTRQPRGERADQARWAVGNCSFNLGRQARADGQAHDALRHLDVMLALGVPQNLLDQAWFERGEALLDLGRRDEALDSYVRALEHVRALGGPLAERARQRIDEIRFGRELDP